MKNPFRPGAGHQPPYLAGRQDEQLEFKKFVGHLPVLTNLIVTGLRGVGKTVLLETLRPIAIDDGWFWAGTDMSESASVSEQSMSIRILADLSGLVSSFVIAAEEKKSIGYLPQTRKIPIHLSYELLIDIYKETPGLESDKLKRALEVVWHSVQSKARGIVLAYDESQNLKDQAYDKQYPLSLLLDVMQNLQRRGYPYLLILTGLPTLFPNLVATRTYSERMFHTMSLDKLSEKESREAIIKPLVKVKGIFSKEMINDIIKYSGGYPYFIQFLCKEAFDLYIQQIAIGIRKPVVIIPEIIRKLDNDFYFGRWNKASDRQRELLMVIAQLPKAEIEFSVQEIERESKKFLKKPFSPSLINQMLLKLIDAGLVYKNRHGKYSFAVPMMSQFINREMLR